MDTAIIFVALIGLMYAAYKGASIIWVAPLFAVLAALGSEHAPLPIFSELYMTKAAEYVKNYYAIFLFGACFIVGQVLFPCLHFFLIFAII